jgi:hypothetical protein
VNEASNVWLYEFVRYHRKDILTRLQTSFGRELVQKPTPYRYRSPDPVSLLIRREFGNFGSDSARWGGIEE